MIDKSLFSIVLIDISSVKPFESKNHETVDLEGSNPDLKKLTGI